MKHLWILLVFGLLPTAGVSAPPQRCDDLPRMMTTPQTQSPRTGESPKDSLNPIAEPTRRQRIQNLKDRIDELKGKLEVSPPPPGDGEEVAPSLPVVPPAVMPEESEPPPPHPSTRPSPVPPPSLVTVEPSPPPPPVELPDTPILPELVPDSQPKPVADPMLKPVPEPLPQPAPQATAEQPAGPELPHHQPAAPPLEVPNPPSAVTDAPPNPESTSLVLPTELLDQAIDRQRMGNNLYAIGAYDLALKNYEMMLQQPLGKEETQWVIFQMANCQRQLGQLAGAQKAYRRVAGDASEEWLGQMSRWWLKELDDREELERRVTELDQVIKALERELNHAP